MGSFVGLLWLGRDLGNTCVISLNLDRIGSAADRTVFIYEVDLLVLTKQGFWLVEIKSWPGKVRGDVVTTGVTRCGWSWKMSPRLDAVPETDAAQSRRERRS